MLRRFTVLIIIVLALFSCAKKSTEWNQNNILQLQAAVPLVGNPIDLDTAGSDVYVTEDQGGLSITNLDNYTRRWITSFVSSDGDTIDLIKIRRVSVDSSINRLFINETDGSDEIRIVDISNPDSMLIVDKITGATQDINDMKFQAITDPGSTFTYEGIFAAGRRVNYGKYGVHITGLPPYFAITLPIDTPANCTGVFMTSQYIYASIEQRGLIIYSRSDGALVGEIDLPGEAQKVKVRGDYAYLPCRQAGLQIVDISNPAAPVRVGSFDTTGYATNVDLWENYAIVSSGGSGVYLIDITNPANPLLIDNITSCGYVNNVRFYDGKALVAARDQGLLIYNIVP
jgi:hypothetical protein